MREEISEVVRNPLMWVAAGAAFCISAGAIILAPRAKEPITRVSSAPPVTVPPVQIAARPWSPPPVTANPPTDAEELPSVKIRSVPARTPSTEAGMPRPSSGNDVNSHEAVAGSREGLESTDPSQGGLPPLDARSFPVPGGLEPPATAPPIEVTPVEPPRNPEPVERAPIVTPPASSRQPERTVVRPRMPTGLLTIFFDADSSTFDGQRRRLPLRVEVWVDGALKARTNDPEKRDVEVGLLSAGWHEVEVVPYVGDLPSQPRRRSVLIEPGTTTEYRAVLRREDGMGCVTKFRPRG